MSNGTDSHCNNFVISSSLLWNRYGADWIVVLPKVRVARACGPSCKCCHPASIESQTITPKLQNGIPRRVKLRKGVLFVGEGTLICIPPTLTRNVHDHAVQLGKTISVYPQFSS